MFSFLSTLLLILLFSLTPAIGAEDGDFVKISDLSYQNWLDAEPITLIPEFEKSCHTVADYLQRANKEYNPEDCVSGLFTASVFLASANAAINESYQQGFAEDRDAVRGRYQQVTEEVIGGALRETPEAGERDHVNLIYTLIVTYSKDVVADYIDNVLDRQEATRYYVQALAEDDRRINREGEYRQVYLALDRN
ncbi:MAG: hypothetical protein V2I32_13070 [Desulforhopalus sp.]|jgi:hypothetical protein|nr:hypothetical protein [Desulforhopalus sp.]